MLPSARRAVRARQRIGLDRDGVAETLLLDVEAASWAVLRRRGPAWTVCQGGRDLLWDAVEGSVRRYRRDGSPDLTGFGIRVGPDGMSVTWPKGG